MAKKQTQAHQKSPKERPRSRKQKHTSPGAPRLGPDLRRLSRFYEPLLLLCALGRTRGGHETTDIPISADITKLSPKQVRRLFLRNLAYLCDYAKGGDTVTAIGVEGTPQKKVFHLAANTCPASKIVPFLKDLLSSLKALYTADSIDEDTHLRLTLHCIHFAKPRIKAYIKLICVNIKACRKSLEQGVFGEDNSIKLLTWLDAFNFSTKPYDDLCKDAFECRHREEMRLLRQLSMKSDWKLVTCPSQPPIWLLRHYLGRLGQHFRVVRSLLSCLPRVANLLDVFEVDGLLVPPRTTAPSIDGKTNLNSIFVRMLPSGSDSLEQYQAALAELDARFNVHERLLKTYKDQNFKPRVHAEVQMLEFFRSNNLSFEDSDPFVACSKPACYCCSLYFRHHPSHPVMPPSHQTIHRNWRPPDSVSGDTEQRDIVNAMIKDMREEALCQIEAKRPIHSWHPDSTTGITQSDVFSLDICDQESQIGESDAMEFADSISSSSGSPVSDVCNSPAESNEAQPLQFSDTYDDFDNYEDSGSDGGVPLNPST